MVRNSASWSRLGSPSMAWRRRRTRRLTVAPFWLGGLTPRSSSVETCRTTASRERTRSSSTRTSRGCALTYDNSRTTGERAAASSQVAGSATTTTSFPQTRWERWQGGGWFGGPYCGRPFLVFRHRPGLSAPSNLQNPLFDRQAAAQSPRAGQVPRACRKGTGLAPHHRRNAGEYRQVRRGTNPQRRQRSERGSWQGNASQQGGAKPTVTPSRGRPPDTPRCGR
jgi:hypothetical protein